MKVYRTKELTSDRQRIYLAARINGATPLESARLAKYPHPESNYHKIENSKRMKYMLNKHENKVFNVVTPQWKINKLADMVNVTIPDDIEELQITSSDRLNVGLKAISELNKMQGHYAPTQSQNMNINVKTDSEQAKEIADNLNKLDRYKQDY